MAIQTNTQLELTHNNLIFYKSRGQYLVRTKPRAVPRNARMQAAALLFGKANRLEKAMRLALLPLLPAPPGKAMQRALASAWYKTLQALETSGGLPPTPLPFLTGFNWKPEAPMQQRFSKAIGLHRNEAATITIAWPALNPVVDIVAPVGTASVKATLILLVMNLETSTVEARETHTIAMTYNNQQKPAETITSELGLGEEQIVVLCLRLHYNGALENLGNEMKWLSMGILRPVGRKKAD